MKELSVSFLWHMHQPNYLDPLRGYFSMPWVRLHATKAYLDMPRMAARVPGMGLTFNLVPSLLEQLDDYTNGTVDYELMLSRKDPVELNPEEKEAILTRFFQAHAETMIKPYARFMELLHARGVNGTPTDIRHALESFSAQDFLDLQVLFNLAWFGFTGRDDPDISAVVKKGRLFNLDDRDLVLDRQMDIIGSIVDEYRALWEDGVADITASPFNHPILPLLCDTSIAHESMPGCLLPKERFCQPGDAKRHVTAALDYFENLFGKRPSGMWPSEGSVSQEALEIISGAGVQWAATDEAVLARSLQSWDRGHDLYRPWEAHGLTMFFRDHFLSDRIGFVYSRNPAETAVDDFIGRLTAIADNSGARHVSVILDGENPWEYFPNSGEEFLEKLYAGIIAEKKLRPVTFTEYLADKPSTGTIERIFPASWINGNFDTWMGDDEEADGWDALNHARQALAEREDTLDDDTRAEAWREIDRAEGSDWFWWYGEDHSSPNDPEFDRLFRAHLERVYTLLGLDPPEEVLRPILKKQDVPADAVPTGLITPAIDGKVTTFYEWLSSGWLPTVGPAGAMSGGENIIRGIYYGFDLEKMYLRMDFTEWEERPDLSDWRISVIIEDDDRYRVDVALGEPEVYMLLKQSKDRWVRRFVRDEVAVDKVIELGVPFRDFSVKSGDRVGIVVVIYEKDIERERYPRSGRISFLVPDEDFEARMWQI